MSKHVSRGLRVLFIAGLCALLPAAAASAGSFKHGTGSLALNGKLVKKLKKNGVKAGKSVSFSYSSSALPFIQINMTNGQATSLTLGGSLKLKAGKSKATLSHFKLNGSTLSAKLGGKTLKFPVSGGTATSPASPRAFSVTVSGVTVKLTKADAKALNKALSKKGGKVNAFKPGTFGTLGYNGQDRQLVELAGTGPNNESITCANLAYAGKDQSNDISSSPTSPASVDMTNCSPPAYGADFPAVAGSGSAGFIDAQTGVGSVAVGGGVLTTCNAGGHCSPVGQQAPFSDPIFNLSSSPTVSAVLPTVGRSTVLTVQLTSAPVIVAGKDTGSLSSPTAANLFLTSLTAGLLNNTFSPSNPYCPSASCSTPDEYGSSKLTVQFK